MIHPLVSYPKNFSIPKFSETQTCSPTKYLDSAGQKIKSTKNWYPLLMRKIFRYTFFFWKAEGFPNDIFLLLWDKDFDNKSWYAPLSLIRKTFRYTDFSEAQTCSPTKHLDSARQNINSTKRRCPLLMRKIFRNSIFSETQKGSPTKCFGTVRQKF